MNLSKIRIDGIPAILWGEPSDKIIIAAHGSHSSKIDDCIWVLAEEVTVKGYQILSFDLPQHGERVYETNFIMPDECVREAENTGFTRILNWVFSETGLEKGFVKLIFAREIAKPAETVNGQDERRTVDSPARLY